MKILHIRTAILSCLLMLVAMTDDLHATERVEVRTLQSWNLPHPFEGPKNLTESVFNNLMHPTVKAYAFSNNLAIEYSKEDDCLLVRGATEGITKVVETMHQIDTYKHHYRRMFNYELTNTNDGISVLKFPKICTHAGGTNLVRREFEYLPVLDHSWVRSIRYGMKKGTYLTLGDFQFPVTAHTKGKGIQGDLRFHPNQSEFGEVHVLSYRGESKEILANRLTGSTEEARVFLDVPYKQLLSNAPDRTNEWALYRAGSKALKLMCPNYASPRVRELFKRKEYRRIVQEIADLVYHGDAVGIGDSGLQPVHRHNALAFYSWRKFSSQKRKKMEKQLLNRWQVWLRQLSKDPTLLGGRFAAKAGDQAGSRELRLVDVETDQLPKLRLFFADNINDQPYFINLRESLHEFGILDLEVNMGTDFISTDKFREVLQGDTGLDQGHAGVVFDVPVPHNDHVEHYFSRNNNFFGLDESIAGATLRQVDQIEEGDWTPGATQRLGQLLRQELPCVIIGQHPFYVYVRKNGPYQLIVGPDTADWRDAPTAHRLGKRISASSK